MTRSSQEAAGPMIAIDLGTSCARAGICRGGRVEIIATVPSYVAFTSNGDVLIGEAAKNQAAANPNNTIFSASRLIGRRYSDPTVQSDMKLWPFKVTKEQNNKPMIAIHANTVDERHISPEEIFSMILIHVKEMAESILGYPIKSAIITVPIYFNHAQRQIVKDAGSIAGVSLQLVSGSIAATMAYGFENSNKNFDPGRNALIFDLGAGTLGVSVVTIEDGGVYRVKAVAGDTHLGGEDFDNRMVDFFVSEFWKKHKRYISSDPRAMSRLRAACERAKTALSSSATTSIGIVSLHNGIDFQATITRTKFEELNVDLFRRCLECVEKCLKDAVINRHSIEDVVLVGGSTRIPRLQFMLTEFFDRKELFESDANTAVIYGAAILASILGGDMHKKVESLILLDITPFSLGVETAKGVMSVLIPRNTKLPTKRERVFSTDHDNQTSFFVRVFEGDGNQTHNINYLGEIELCGIPPTPKGVTKIHLTLEIDANGTFIVSAEDKAHGIKKKIAIGISNSNSNDDSEENNCLSREENDEDDRNRERAKKLLEKSVRHITASISEDSSIFQLLSDHDKNELDKAIESVVRWMEKSSDAIKEEDFANKTEELEGLYGDITGAYLSWRSTIGIDFGSAYSCVGAWMNDHVEIVSDELGSRTVPSCVAFTDHERLVGESARQQSSMNPANTIFDIKHLIGKNYSDLSTENKPRSSLTVIPDAADRPTVQIQYRGKVKRIFPEEIAATIFQKTKEISESQIGSTVKNAVVAVPSYFSSCQRKALRNAAIVAGLNTLRIVNEPTAAAIAYYAHRTISEGFFTGNNKKTVLIFDLGARFLDVSVVSVRNGALEVIASVGSPDLGGDYFHENMADHFVQQFEVKEGGKNKIGDNSRGIGKLRAACEKAKRVLSTVPRTTIEIDSLCDGVDFCAAITRDEFEEINSEIFEMCVEAVENCLEEAGIDKSLIDDVIPVGGSTRIPKIQQQLQEFFNGKELYKSINPDEAVAYGATIYAALLVGNKEQRTRFNDLTVHDITALTLGLETAGGDITVLIPRNNPVPTKKEQIFTTSGDDQTSVSIQLRACESGCSLGTYDLTELPFRPRGIPKVHVSFSLNIDGILTVEAFDTSYGNNNKRTEICCEERSSFMLSGEEMEQLRGELGKYELDDEENLKRIEARNSLEEYAYRIRDLARNARVAGKLYFTEMRKIERAVDQAIDWLDHNEQVVKAAHEFEQRLMDLKLVCDPLVMKS